jgi:CubicO group peptidase (beta-lactamase class C family)
MTAPIDSAAFDEILRAAVEAGDVPNAVALAADRDGVRYEAAAGPRRAGTDEPVTADSLLRIASMTKPVTTVAALQLVERSLLDLDTPVDVILPAWARLMVLTGWDGDTPRRRPPATRATIRHLMTHTSGLGYWFWDAGLARWERLTGTPNILSGSRAVFTAPLLADPGSRVVYGLSTDWLGLVVEIVAGQSLDRYLTQNILGPLGMERTTFAPSDAERAGLVPVHFRRRDGGPTPGPASWVATGVDWSRAPEWWSGGHGLYSTPRDYLRFQRMLLGDGQLDGVRLLRAETVRAMFANQIGELTFPTFIPTAHPASSDSWRGPQGLVWGLGLTVNTRQEPGLRAPGSGGWAGTHNTYFWVDRSSGITAALYSQFLPFLDAGALRLYDHFERTLYRLRSLTSC